MRVVGLVVLVLLGAGCRIDAEVRIVLEENGSGEVQATVTLDPDAVQRLEAGDRPLDATIPLADLTEAGWTVGAWERTDEGGASLSVSHDFVNADELAVRLGELDGGAFVRDSTVKRERGVFESRDEVALDVDLTAVGAQLRNDEELVASLTAAGLDVDALDAQLETELQDALRLTVVVEVPGNQVTTVELEPGQTESVSASRTDFDASRLVLVVLAGALVTFAVVLFVLARRSARRART